MYSEIFFANRVEVVVIHKLKRGSKCTVVYVSSFVAAIQLAFIDISHSC